MQKQIGRAIAVNFLFLLAGCQSSPVSTMFSPTPYYSTGMTLSESVQEALSRSDDPLISQVHVQTLQNDVILSGYVKKIRQSDVAEQIAREVQGVQSVQNKIIVRQ